MSEKYFFQLQNKLHYGVGCSIEVANIIQGNDYSSILILVDEGVSEHSIYYKDFLKGIKQKKTNLTVMILRGSEEPSYDYIDKIYTEIKNLKSPDVIIGIGGGSSLDITKVVSILLTNRGKAIDYRGFDKVEKPGIPVIAIPTTAGAGSEVTINAPVIDKDKMVKMGINGKFMNAEYSILDSEWLISLPHNAMLSAGLDAMLHAIESFSCKNANLLTRLIATKAFGLVYRALPEIMVNIKDKQKLQNLLFGSYLAGVSLFNSGSSVAHAFSYPLGVYFGVPHGIGGGIVLPSVIKLNIERNYHDYSILLEEIEPGFRGSISQKSNAFYDKIVEIYKLLKVPRNYSAWEVSIDDIDLLEDQLRSFQGAFDQSPARFTGNDVRQLLIKHIA
jgi:alcohol dehydrogenase